MNKTDLEMADNVIQEVVITYKAFTECYIDFGLDEMQKTAREKFKYSMNSEEHFPMLPDSYLDKLQEYINRKIRDAFYCFYQEAIQTEMFSYDN